MQLFALNAKLNVNYNNASGHALYGKGPFHVGFS